MSQRLYVGIDTGGTYTDAALIDPAARRVLATAKRLTTKGDLAIGVGEALHAVVDDAADVVLVSLSTTLATNAVVEGHGDRVGIVLIGFDDQMVERTKVRSAFPDMPVIRVAGGHDHGGVEVAPLDVEALQTQVLLAASGGVSAFAIAAAFSVRNPAHEVHAGKIVASATNLPVTLSSEIASSLDAPRRAVTAVLNARLIGKVTGLTAAVQRAMHAASIDAPLMLVKGDGSLALAETVALRPIETVLSGPAASVVGARWLSGLDDFIVSDMGGTTTDVGVVLNGRPRLNEEGSEVGGWRTMVRAIDIRTAGLGGDSEVLIDGSTVSLGATRCVPLALLAQRYPSTLTMLGDDLADVRSGGGLHGRFAVAAFGAPPASEVAGLSDAERALLSQLDHGPRPLREVASSPRDRRVLESLRRRTFAHVAAFTPSDAAHVLGMQDNWDRAGAELGARLGARLRDMKSPTPERTTAFASDVWDRAVTASGRIVIDTALGRTDGGPLIEAMCAGRPDVGLAHVNVSPAVPLVPVGGPVRVFYPEVGRRLGADLRFVDNGDVANAIGAATGTVMATVVVQVEADPNGGFRVHGPTAVERAGTSSEAISLAEDIARDAAAAELARRGADDAEFRVSQSEVRLPGLAGEHGVISATVTVEAIGRPHVSSGR